MLTEFSSFGVVAIGRNEGARLKRCLHSLSAATNIVYVDSGSIDGSVKWAQDLGTDVIELEPGAPFTAARARNAGFKRLTSVAPDVEFVQFIDGDCEMNPDWPLHATSFLKQNAQVCAVFGRRRERYPERSIYNRLCDMEWDVPIGEARACGGDIMIRAAVLKKVGGYRDELIAGEEPELCIRLRAEGWKIWRLDYEMTWHDAAMTRFAQWWLRNVRSGYAFAEGAILHGSLPERHWVWESRRALLWGLWLPIACITAGAIFWPWGLIAALIYPVQLGRRIISKHGPLGFRAQSAWFELLGRFPEALGQIKFVRDRLMGHRGHPIEYK
jgi:GT2 family glycosyltransferase